MPDLAGAGCARDTTFEIFAAFGTLKRRLGPCREPTTIRLLTGGLGGPGGQLQSVRELVLSGSQEATGRAPGIPVRYQA